MKPTQPGAASKRPSGTEPGPARGAARRIASVTCSLAKCHLLLWVQDSVLIYFFFCCVCIFKKVSTCRRAARSFLRTHHLAMLFEARLSVAAWDFRLEAACAWAKWEVGKPRLTCLVVSKDWRNGL